MKPKCWPCFRENNSTLSTYLIITRIILHFSSQILPRNQKFLKIVCFLLTKWNSKLRGERVLKKADSEWKVEIFILISVFAIVIINTCMIAMLYYLFHVWVKAFGFVYVKHKVLLLMSCQYIIIKTCAPCSSNISSSYSINIK